MVAAESAPVNLEINPAAEVDRIVAALRAHVRQTWHRGGAVLGISGGVDSSTVLHLCIRAYGTERVLPLLLPEKDSSEDSERLARMVAAEAGVTPVLETLEPALTAL